jgi:hypothetical protein
MTSKTDNQRINGWLDTVFADDEPLAEQLRDAFVALYEVRGRQLELRALHAPDGKPRDLHGRLVLEVADHHTAAAAERLDRLTREQDRRLRWARAASWARGQSFGPYAHGIGEEEAERIEEIAKWILDLGEDAAWERYAARYGRQGEQHDHGSPADR